MGIPGIAAAGPPSPGAGAPPLVTVAPVTLQDVNPPTEYIGHVEALQVVDDRWVSEAGVGAAQRRRNVGMAHREPADMRLVDDRLALGAVGVPGGVVALLAQAIRQRIRVHLG